ncbi:thrombospondin type 3 repeat-containing protein [Flavobacteriaceae bacterium D16]|nr:thrombospondin type 3 repeat-containing protein [Flavobacteriaceae bacterium D16]
MIRKVLLLLFLCSYVSYGQVDPQSPNVDPGDASGLIYSDEPGKPVNLFEVKEKMEAYWAGRDRNRKGSGYKPYKRWENYWMHFIDQNGNLPTSKELYDSWQSKASSAKPPNPVSDWSPIGPFNPGTLGNRLPGTGRVNAIAIDPNNAAIWYAGAPAGGIWKSTNAGASWTNLFDNFPQIGVSGIAIDPNDSNTIYIATGDDDAADSYSIGVFKSTDGGQTWNETGLNPSNTNISWVMNEIVIDPTDSNTLWVGSSFGLYKTIDGGDNWVRVQTGFISDFKLKPGDPDTVYAVSNDHIGGGGNATSYFKTSDGGASFSQMDDPLLPTSCGRVVLGVSPADPEVLYILTANTSANDFTYQGLYKSINSGETFAESPNTTDIMESSQAWFDLALEVSPTNANELYMGCLNVWKSINGGNSWNKLNNWFRNDAAYTHADIHTIKIINGNVYAGTDGGLYLSENGGASFTDVTSNMAVTQFYKIAIAGSNSNKISGGTQDNSGFVFNNNSWNVFTGGDGMDYEFDPNNTNIIYGFSQNGGNLFITTNSGQSVTAVGAPRDDEGNRISGNWITPLAVGGDSQVYAGFDAIYRLNGNAWEKLATIPGTDGAIEDIEVDPTNPQVIYAAEGSFVQRSEDGGQTFSAFFNAGALISDIAINTNDGSAIYVATSRRVGRSQTSQQSVNRKVYKVPVNNGIAGREIDITGDLPTDQAFFALVHQGRHTDNPVYVGTNLGVYRIDDTLINETDESLTVWEEYFTNLPSVAVSDLEISVEDEVIVASTYGRGTWKSAIPIQVQDDDIRLVSIAPEAERILCGEIIPDIVVENKGLNPINSIDITYRVNGGADVNLTESVTLNSGETTTVTLPSLTIGTVGPVNFEVETTVTNDAFADNNVVSQTFFVNDFGVGDALNTFEDGSDALISYNDVDPESSVWERGTPTGTLLNQAASGTQVYGTNLDGNHPDGVKSFLVSNCYELSSILAPVLKFTMAYDLEVNFDIVFVEYSTDDGASWNVLGNVNSQPNWYNSDRTNENSGNDDDCQNCPGAQWTGTNATLTEYAYDFVANAALGETDLTNEANVLFRIVFQSDPNLNQEGVVIDDFVVEGFQDDDDDDNDGVLDVDDNCPLIGNANQLDTDADGLGDACDDDDDNDGVLDVDDNCPLVANADQADADGDGIGDVCDEDADNDGVPNDLDLCDDTPAGTVVDVTGCPVFSLPPDNFSIQTIGESCRNSNNGSISITAVQSLEYTATVSGPNTDETLNFTDALEISPLSSGEYTVCITVAGQADYEVCYTLIVPQPEDLSVSSRISSLDNQVILSLAGGKKYTIRLNNEVFETTDNEITLPLSKIENTLMVSTDKACQGTFEETIFLSSKLLVYPNPVEGSNLNIFMGDNELEEVEVSLYTLNGVKVMGKKYTLLNREVSLNVDRLARGVYLLNIRTERSLVNYKILRK